MHALFIRNMNHVIYLKYSYNIEVQTWIKFVISLRYAIQ